MARLLGATLSTFDLDTLSSGAASDEALLAYIQLADSKGTVYDPGTDIAKVDSIELHNSNVTAEVVELYLNDGSNEYKIFKKSLAAFETVQIPLEDSFIITAASTITGNTTTASKVTCAVIGSIQTTGTNRAFIQLANAKGDIYDPGANNGKVTAILFHNINTTSETVVMLLNTGANEYQLLKISLIANETLIWTYGDKGLPVNSSSKLTGNTTTAAKVTCLVMGTER